MRRMMRQTTLQVVGLRLAGAPESLPQFLRLRDQCWHYRAGPNVIISAVLYAKAYRAGPVLAGSLFQLKDIHHYYIYYISTVSLCVLVCLFPTRNLENEISYRHLRPKSKPKWIISRCVQWIITLAGPLLGSFLRPCNISFVFIFLYVSLYVILCIVIQLYKEIKWICYCKLPILCAMSILNN